MLDENAPYQQIDAPWMRDPAAWRVMDALNRDGVQALFVGGCVRDAVLGRTLGDMDIATVHTPVEATALLEAAGLKVVPTGIDHGTLTAVAEGRPFEVTTLRRDVETFGRRATVAFTKDWKEDAERRDFTINTLLADMDGKVFDPLGRGLEDAKAGRILFVGDPETRIAEDYLRILRFFRFHTHYGRGEPDAAALRACKKMASHLGGLSRERVTAEFLRILAAENPADIVETMISCNCTMDLVGPDYTAARLVRLADLQSLYNAPDIWSRLLVLTGQGDDRMQVLRNRLILAKRDYDRIQDIKKAANELLAPSQAVVKKAVYLYGNDIALHALLFTASAGTAVPDNVIAIARTWQAPVFPLSGTDLKQTGIPEGPELGRILKETECWWIAQDYLPNKTACLKQAGVVASGQKGPI